MYVLDKADHPNESMPCDEETLDSGLWRYLGRWHKQHESAILTDLTLSTFYSFQDPSSVLPERVN